MKRIMTAIASDWAKLPDIEKSPYLKMAEKDSERYKEDMKTFSQTETFKKLERSRKRNNMFRQRIRKKEKKDSMEKEAFELFCQDHGGSLEEIRELWSLTVDSTKEEYRNKAFEKAKRTVTTSRSKRQIKVPSRFEDSFGINTSNISAFENFIKGKSEVSMDKLKAEWQIMSEAEKAQFASNTSVSYKVFENSEHVSDSDEDSE